MKPHQEQFKIELILRSSQSSQGNRSRLSAGHKRRQKVQKNGDKPINILGSNSLQKEYTKIERVKNSPGCLQTIFHKEHKERQYKQFSQKCMSFLSKKKLSCPEENENKRSNFSTMLQNIKNVLKQNERRQRENREQIMQPYYQQQFQCVRSQIHQVYANDEQIQLFKMIRSNQSRNSSRKDSTNKTQKQQKTDTNNTNNTITPGNRYQMNPFLRFNTVVCFTMALNNPEPIKKQLFEAPTVRVSSSMGKKTVQISKPVQPRSMSFQLSGQYDSQYMKKLKNFLDFLFKVNYSNNIYVSLNLNKSEQYQAPQKYKVYIGKGNNSLLIKSLMKRRFWWEVTDNIESSDINFYWSQNIIEDVHECQRKGFFKNRTAQKQIRRQRYLQENIDLNRKILSAQKSISVQKFILKEGYTIPFEETFTTDIISNHLPRNYCIGSKKSLFKSLFNYYTKIKNKNPFDYIPKTYHIQSNSGDDIEYRRFIKQNQNQPQKVWIVKPGQNSNRGRGINLAAFNSINQLLKKCKHQNGQPMTYIVQSYINRPFLYNNRKFDIRHYILLTSVNGIVKGYWYRQGYIRTSSQIFDLQDLDNIFIHLTNDAIQKNSQDYQKYEPANKLSYSQFQRYLDYSFPSKNYNFEKDIIPKMKQMTASIIKANYLTIDNNRHQNNFQIFGLDFMIDKDFKPWLIEVNYNPCLEINCAILQRVIPAMVQNSFRIGLDPLFPPTSHFPAAKRSYLSDHYLKNLRYELIFDQDSLKNKINNDYGFDDQKQEEDEYQDEGHEINQIQV